MKMRATINDAAIILAIARRAVGSATAVPIAVSVSVHEIVMDITACHLNGCPLDLPRLKAAPDAVLMHDVVGITRYLDRKTGKLRMCFLPRTALPESRHA